MLGFYWVAEMAFSGDGELERGWVEQEGGLSLKSSHPPAELLHEVPLSSHPSEAKLLRSNVQLLPLFSPLLLCRWNFNASRMRGGTGQKASFEEGNRNVCSHFGLRSQA